MRNTGLEEAQAGIKIAERNINNLRYADDHIFSELSSMTHPSWVALHSMAHSFTELDKAMVHMIRLVSCL